MLKLKTKSAPLVRGLLSAVDAEATMQDARKLGGEGCRQGPPKPGAGVRVSRIFLALKVCSPPESKGPGIHWVLSIHQANWGHLDSYGE
jgi:hypothetical protein